jgi:hypothetical protein
MGPSLAERERDVYMTQSVREVAPAGKWAVAELWTYIGWLLEKGSFPPAPSHQPSPTAWFDGLARSGLHVWSLRRRSPNYFCSAGGGFWPSSHPAWARVGRRPGRQRGPLPGVDLRRSVDPDPPLVTQRPPILTLRNPACPRSAPRRTFPGKIAGSRHRQLPATRPTAADRLWSPTRA